jgi:hypothetical protein
VLRDDSVDSWIDRKTIGEIPESATAESAPIGASQHARAMWRLSGCQLLREAQLSAATLFPGQQYGTGVGEPTTRRQQRCCCSSSAGERRQIK